MSKKALSDEERLRKIPWVVDMRNDTIEECAQVAEQMVMLPYRACPADMAAAIRALKDKS